MSSPFGLADRIANRWARSFPARSSNLETRRALVSFTFDDVPDSAFSRGAEILEQHGGRGTYYVSGQLAGRIEANRRLLDWEGCRELVARGHELACHTYSHQTVRSLGRSLGADLDRNSAALSAVRGSAPENFAFPYAFAAPGARRELGRRFRSCRAGIAGINRGATDLMHLAAVEIRAADDVDALAPWIMSAVANPGWLIFFTHDVSDRPTPFGCRPAVLDRLAALARERGCAILPVGSALDRMGVEQIGGKRP